MPGKHLLVFSEVDNVAASWLEHLVHPAAVDERSFFDKFDRSISPLEQRNAEMIEIQSRPVLNAVERGLVVNQGRNGLGRLVGTRKCVFVMIRSDLRDRNSEPAEPGAMNIR